MKIFDLFLRGYETLSDSFWSNNEQILWSAQSLESSHVQFNWQRFPESQIFPLNEKSSSELEVFLNTLLEISFILLY